MLLYSTTLDIKDTLTKEGFIEMVIQWNQKSTHPENVIPDIKWTGERNIRYGNEDLWLAIEEYRNKNIIAARYERKAADDAIWDTDFVMNFDTMKMTVQLDRVYTEGALMDNLTYATPYLITMLIDGGYLKDDNGLEVLKEATPINQDNIRLLADVINGEAHYRLPIVYISKTEENRNPLNVGILCYKLKGAAHVLLEEDISLTDTLSAECNENNESLGGIGIYYPNGKHRRFMYRTSYENENDLMDKITTAVFQYLNAQNLPSLSTWQGVNNALLTDRYLSQKEKADVEEQGRLEAEDRTRKAEEEKTQAKNETAQAKDETRKAKNETAQAKDETAKALERQRKAEDKYDSYFEAFDSENEELRKQLTDYMRKNESLKYENQKLMEKLADTDNVPIIFLGDEEEFYQGEIKEMILDAVAEQIKNVEKDTRRYDVLLDILKGNDYQEVGAARKNAVKKMFKGYDSMSKTLRNELHELGIEIVGETNHYRLTYYGDGRYSVTVSKTPSDKRRTGDNTAATIINEML